MALVCTHLLYLWDGASRMLPKNFSESKHLVQSHKRRLMYCSYKSTLRSNRKGMPRNMTTGRLVIWDYIDKEAYGISLVHRTLYWFSFWGNHWPSSAFRTETERNFAQSCIAALTLLTALNAATIVVSFKLDKLYLVCKLNIRYVRLYLFSWIKQAEITRHSCFPRLELIVESVLFFFGACFTRASSALERFTGSCFYHPCSLESSNSTLSFWSITRASASPTLPGSHRMGLRSHSTKCPRLVTGTLLSP